MTPERMAALVARWVRLYTRGLPAAVAQRRIDEVGADVHDHIAHERSRGMDDTRIARSVGSRMMRGLLADASWRGAHTRAAGTSTEDTMRPRKTLARPALRVLLGVAVVLAVPAIGMLVSDNVNWGPGDFVGAGILLALVGVTIELAISRSGNVVASAGIALLGVAAAVFGNADDAPGLVLIGLLLIAGAAAMAARVVQRSR